MRQSLFSTEDGRGRDPLRRKVVTMCEHRLESRFMIVERGLKPRVWAVYTRMQSKKVITLDSIFSTQSGCAPSGAIASQNRIRISKVQVSLAVGKPTLEMTSGLGRKGVLKRCTRHMVVSITCLLCLKHTQTALCNSACGWSWGNSPERVTLEGT